MPAVVKSFDREAPARAGDLLPVDDVIRELVRREVRAELAKVTTGQVAPRYVTVHEYAASRSISPSTVRNAIRAGRLPATRIGTAVRVAMDAEIGRPVVANANRPEAGPAARAERILARGASPPKAEPRKVGAKVA